MQVVVFLIITSQVFNIRGVFDIHNDGKIQFFFIHKTHATVLVLLLIAVKPTVHFVSVFCCCCCCCSMRTRRGSPWWAAGELQASLPPSSATWRGESNFPKRASNRRPDGPGPETGTSAPRRRESVLYYQNYRNEWTRNPADGNIRSEGWLQNNRIILTPWLLLFFIPSDSCLTWTPVTWPSLRKSLKTRCVFPEDSGSECQKDTPMW